MSDTPSLYAKHAHLVDKLAGRYVVPGADIEDSLQEARLALWEACGAYQPMKGVPFGAFATLVIKRRLIDQLRASTRGKNAILSNAEREAVIADHASFEDQLDNQALIEKIISRSRSFPETHRKALLDIINGEPVASKAEDNARVKVRRKLAKL